MRKEDERIERWLEDVRAAAASDIDVALEWVVCRRLIKDYDETFERGLQAK